MAGSKHVDLRKIGNSGTAIFKKHLVFLNKKWNDFEIKIVSFGPNKTTLFFLIEDKL